MKAITLTQPYATLVAIGAKQIETRSWATSYRGELAIHAGQGLGYFKRYSAFRAACESEPFRSVLAAAGYTSASHLPSGVIVATARLLDCVPTENDAVARQPGMPWLVARYAGEYYEVPPRVDTHEFSFGDYSPGRFAWLLADVQPLATPVPARGRQRLWDWTTERELVEQ